MDQISNSTALRNPVIIPESAYNTSHLSVTTLMKQRSDSTYMGFALYGYWGLIFVLAAIINVAHWCFPYASEKFAKTRVVNWLRRHLICPQVIRPSFTSKLKTLTGKNLTSEAAARCNFGILESIYRTPVRVHALLLFIYACVVTVLCCTDYTIVTPNTIFRCPRGQKYVDYADRTGIIGTMQLPLVFLFASRNNPLTKITGLSYRTFQVFHKWISRITFVLLLLHCVFYLSYVRARGDYIARWGLLKWRMANTAFIAICITTAWGSVRRRYYEWFKSSHKILLVVFVVGAWYHCLTLGWIEYIAVSFSIWAADYICRLAKIASTGGILQAKCKVIYETEVIHNKRGTKSYKKVPHSLRMEVNHSGWWKPFPGVYCWVYFMRWNMFWQAHPFTVVSATAQQNFNQLVFIIRVKRGLTNVLAKFISSLPGSQCSIPILVEGPYGTNIPFKAYDHAVFVAGGVGMTVVYSIAMDLAQIYRAQVLRGQKEATEKSISIIWMVPNFESVTLFREEIERLRQFSDILQLQIFVTRKLQDPRLKKMVAKYEKEQSSEALVATKGSEPEVIDYISESSRSDRESRRDGRLIQKVETKKLLEDLLRKNGNSSVSIEFNEKPDLTSAVHNIYTLAGPTAVIACGPSTLNADVRVVTVECLKKHRSVEYFEQELLW
ncbi:DEKNAAC103548 [Brettanomyces naardenensis]|uniref:DEKNAAC103548 n=1 Tax=Brettanomyces naardenensis TaxID=13370 RepID=A0A448YNS4_BRENA|nr:DEKNAAC103548 [Brettanomyces naardenensis]